MLGPRPPELPASESWHRVVSLSSKKSHGKDIKRIKGGKMWDPRGSKFTSNGIMHECFSICLFQKRIKRNFLFVILMVPKSICRFCECHLNSRASARGEVKQENIVPWLRRNSIVACKTGGHFLARIYGIKGYGERDLLGKDLSRGTTFPGQRWWWRWWHVCCKEPA